jgi:tetratricopeptide (TPR) repeat protein
MKKTSPPPSPVFSNFPWQFFLWSALGIGSLFLVPTCLDRYLAPRFFFVSTALAASILLIWKDLRARGDARLHAFDVLLLGWYGLNLASCAWAFSSSEAIFYAQKTLLLFFAYWLTRQALLRDGALVRRTLQPMVVLLITATILVVAWQLYQAVAEHQRLVRAGQAYLDSGLDNTWLYDYVVGLSGNKALTSDFLFLLLVFSVLCYHEFRRKSIFWLSAAALCGLILLLQTRAVYLALALSGTFYLAARVVAERDFRGVFLRKILPIGLLALGGLVAVLAWKGQASSFAERLNPLRYGESDSARERLFVWYKTNLLNDEHYWLGVGDGSWKIWFPSHDIGGGYRLAERNIVFTRAHNDYLEIRSELGIIGAVWFIGLFAAAFGALLWAWRRHAAQRHDWLVIAAGLLGYCVIQYFDFPRERPEFQVILAIFFAWAAHGAREGLARLPSLRLAPAANVWGILAIAGLGLNLVVGWYRMQGDIHTARLYQAQAKNRWNEVVAEARRAENRWYEYSDVALPLAWHLGVAYYELKQMDRAIVELERAYRLNPWSFQVLNNYGATFAQAGRYRECVPIFEEALRINPRFDECKFNVAHAYYELGEYPKALEWLNRVDTIETPAIFGDKGKNKFVMQKRDEYRAIVEEKMKAAQAPPPQ